MSGRVQRCFGLSFICFGLSLPNLVEYWAVGALGALLLTIGSVLAVSGRGEP